MMHKAVRINFQYLFGIGLYLILSLSTTALHGQVVTDESISKEWLREHLQPQTPRLIFDIETQQLLAEKLTTDAHIQQLYQHIKAYADYCLQQPPLTYQKRGRRLLSVSREALQRMLALAMVYRMEQQPEYLHRLEAELLTVAHFPDWNPSHFLDAAEMATAVGLALDWCGKDMAPDILKTSKNALLEKAIKPGIGITWENWWWVSEHNWNLVCHGGLAIAALAVFEEEPDLASYTLNRTVERFPLGLLPYQPDGAYNEGPGYWFYATNFLTLTISAFESAVGTGFDFLEVPGVARSAEFSEMTAGPSGDYYNYFDASTKGYHTLRHIGLLSWFGQRKGFRPPDKALEHAIANIPPPEQQSKGRFSTLYLLNLLRLSEDAPEIKREPVWLAQGDAPLVVFAPKQPDGLYLAAKGGSAKDNHANMDAGSFILEWKRTRFSIDLGNQDYYELERTIGVGALWNPAQDSPRWDLLTKNNFGHSTLTINGDKHQAKGRAVVHYSDLNAENPEVAFDLSPLYGNQLKRAIRTFKKISDSELLIQDEVELSENTQSLTWQWITDAEVQLDDQTATLTIDGKQIQLEVTAPADFELAVVALDPPPSKLDKVVPNLKRIEVRMQSQAFKKKKGRITVKVTGLP
ncbi:heparinase II/III domain-containing protein [Phaeodactylibacter xiamenensis]|uniref:heparinase II/III domain-containing protein n=1 Tax=Phaeodactylibacter xiamenensis TaxID=1524460 RepID=UPI0024A83652|nr:heparinase II/III family protein [Phaeodactylibacter xiamenensis]